MTIPALIVANSLIGSSIAYGSRLQIRTLQRNIFSTRYFSALMILQLTVVLPVGIYFYIFYPDWSWMYIVDTENLAPAVGVMSMASYPVSAAMGYLVGYYSARSTSDWVTIVFMVFMVVGLAGLIIASYNQLVWLGTYTQYHRDVGLKPISATSLVPSIILALLGIFTCWGYLVYRFYREGKLSTQTT